MKTIKAQSLRASMFAAAALTVLGAATMVSQPASAACVAGKNTDPNSTVSCEGAANAVKDGTNITAPGETAPVSTTTASGDPANSTSPAPGGTDEADAGIVKGSDSTQPSVAGNSVLTDIVGSITNQGDAPADPAEATSPAPTKTDEADTGIVK